MSQTPTHTPFSKASTRSSILLVTLLVVVFVAPQIYQWMLPETAVSVENLPDKEKAALNELEHRTSGRAYEERTKFSRFSAPPSKFNPNSYTKEEWMALGLSEKQAAVVLKFTKRKLRSNDDLKKIFVINDELFDLIKDSTVYETVEKNEVLPSNSPRTTKISVDINTASEEELMKVPGIGPFYAKNIVKKRNELGGYVEKKQLLELWKMNQEKYDQCMEYFTCSTSNIKRLNINTATAEELAAHPYITWNVANSLVKMRTQVGKYKKLEDIKKSVLVTPELYIKIYPYLTIE